MNKISGALAVAVLMTAVLGCSRITEKVLTPNENFTRTAKLWDDVPQMDGMEHSEDMELPLAARLLIKFALNNLWRANDDKSPTNAPISGDWIAYTTKASTDDIQNFYSKDKMSSFGQWDTDKGSSCVNGKQGQQQAPSGGAICVYKKVVNEHATLVAVIAIEDKEKKQTDLFFLRLEKDVPPSPSPTAKGK